MASKTRRFPLLLATLNASNLRQILSKDQDVDVDVDVIFLEFQFYAYEHCQKSFSNPN